MTPTIICFVSLLCVFLLLTLKKGTRKKVYMKLAGNRPVLGGFAQGEGFLEENERNGKMKRKERSHE